MQILGLLMLLVTVFGGVYLQWFTNGASTTSRVSEERLDTYREAISDAKAVGELVAKTGAQVEVYVGISVDSKSSVLDLSNRGLSGSLKGEVRMLTNLEELNLSGNKFTGLPAEVGQLSQLKILNLSGNPLTGLPHELGNLQELQVLDLRNTTYAKQDLEVIKAKLSGTTRILVD